MSICICFITTNICLPIIILVYTLGWAKDARAVSAQRIFILFFGFQTENIAGGSYVDLPNNGASENVTQKLIALSVWDLGEQVLGKPD